MYFIIIVFCLTSVTCILLLLCFIQLQEEALVDLLTKIYYIENPNDTQFSKLKSFITEFVPTSLLERKPEEYYVVSFIYHVQNTIVCNLVNFYLCNVKNILSICWIYLH